MQPRRKHSDFELYRRLFHEARPFWAHIAALFALSVLATPLTLLSPWPLKIIVDSVIGSQKLPRLLLWTLPDGISRTDPRLTAVVAGLIVVIALAKQLLELSSSVLHKYIGERMVLAFRSKLFRHSQRLSLAYHDAIGTADSTYRIQYDAPAIQWIALDAFIPLVSSLLTLVAMIVIMTRIDWTLALVALTVAPVLFVVSQVFSRRLKLRWREAKDIESSSLSVVQEVLSSVRVVKAFVQEDREQQRYVRRASRNLQQQMRLALTGGLFTLIVAVAMAAGTAIVLFLAARHVEQGRITLGELILVMSYLAQLYSPLQTLSQSAASLQGSLVSAERAFELLDEAPDVVEKPNARTLVRARGEVAFENVSFAYVGSRPALRDVSFHVAAGSRVGIAGTTGAGKSTMMSLVMRLYDPTEGRILLDGIDLRDLKIHDLRNQFAIVLQDPVLFSCSIGQNIAYAFPDASEAEITAAAQAANAHDFISRLPEGYATDVGERGVQLSGGERQRLSLARAFLKDAPILILDEPTSSVDTITEGVILDAMDRLMRGRTTFMIAHRLSTLDICDVRIRMEQGELTSFAETSGSGEDRPVSSGVA